MKEPNDDPFNPKNLKLLADQVTAFVEGKNSFAGRPIPAYARIKFYRFPREILEAIILPPGPRANFHAVIAVLTALFELWYASGRWDGRHRNPVKLTSAYVQRRFGVSRKQKGLALAMLQEAGVVALDYRSSGRNPWVVLKWEPLVQ